VYDDCRRGDGVSPQEGAQFAMALALHTFYLGRLSGRDDTKDWHKIALGRVAELQDKARSSELLKACLNFYLAKIK